MHQGHVEPAEVDAAVLLGHNVKAECPLIVVCHELHVPDLEHDGAHGEIGRKKVLAAGCWCHVNTPGLTGHRISMVPTSLNYLKLQFIPNGRLFPAEPRPA